MILRVLPCALQYAHRFACERGEWCLDLAFTRADASELSHILLFLRHLGNARCRTNVTNVGTLVALK